MLVADSTVHTYIQSTVIRPACYVLPLPESGLVRVSGRPEPEDVPVEDVGGGPAGEGLHAGVAAVVVREVRRRKLNLKWEEEKRCVVL